MLEWLVGAGAFCLLIGLLLSAVLPPDHLQDDRDLAETRHKDSPDAPSDTSSTPTILDLSSFDVDDDASLHAIPDFVGELELTDVPLAERAEVVLQELAILAERPDPKSLRGRQQRYDYLFLLLSALSEEDSIRAMSGDFTPSPAVTALTAALQKPDVFLPEEKSSRRELKRVNALPSPLSYLDSLGYLPDGLTEEDLLQGGLGDDTEMFLCLIKMGMPHDAIRVFREGFEVRIFQLAAFRERWGLRPFPFMTHPDTKPVLKVPVPGSSLLDDIPTEPGPTRKRAPRYRPTTLLPSLVPLPKELPARAGEKLSTTELLDRRYEELVKLIITDARRLFASVGLPVFPQCSPTASVDDVAALYGTCITARTGKSDAHLRYEGCRQVWRCLVRVLEAALESPARSLDNAMLIKFMDTARVQGPTLARAFKWAHVAFGTPLFLDLANEPTIAKHSVGTMLGAARAPKDVPDQAIWVPDALIRYLSDLCHDPDPLVAGRAVFFYLHAIGGWRLRDVMHIRKLVLIPPLRVDVHATYEKITGKPGTMEVTTIPLVDYKGRSLQPAIEVLQRVQGQTFLLPDCIGGARLQAQGLKVPYRTPFQECSYNHAQELLGVVLRQFYASLPEELSHLVGAFDDASTHSFKGWLDTFAQQGGLEDRDVDILCHWNKQKMRAHYNRNYSGMELRARLRVLRLLASSWKSAPPGGYPDDPPAISSLPLLANEEALREEYAKQTIRL